MHNIEIRTKLKENRIFGYEIAAKLGISETSYSRKWGNEKWQQMKKKKYIELLMRLRRKNENRPKRITWIILHG